MKEPKLSSAEVEVWHAWKKATDAVMARVEREIIVATGLSGADFGVLSRLADGGEELRQQELADMLGWDKSRLSHQLSRMEERGLLTRKSAGPKSVVVRIAAKGTKALVAARPAHAHGVRTHLLDKIPPAQRATFLRLLDRLRDG